MPTYSADVIKLMTRRTMDDFFAPIYVGVAPGNDAGVGSAVSRTFTTTSMTIYSGAQPSAQTIEANWVNYNQNSASCLAHYSSGPTWLYNAGTLTYYFTNTNNAITTNALRSGAASWAIIWKANSVSITSLSDPPAAGKFIVVPVTNNSGIGGIRYTSISTTQGQAFVPYDGGLTIVEA
jgi:hypothetical protein